jgi:hypothetical protein
LPSDGIVPSKIGRQLSLILLFYFQVALLTNLLPLTQNSEHSLDSALAAIAG